MKPADLRFALLGALLCLCPAARADDSNSRPYFIGSRAAGMGGANTALADDGGGPYYNPAGIAFAQHSSLSLSVSVYGLVMGSQRDALGAGHDLNFRDVNTFPASTSAVFKFGSRQTPDGSQANAIALSVFIPDGLLLDVRDALGTNEDELFISQQDQTIWAGATYARRLGRLGLGVSAFGLVTTAKSLVDISLAESATQFLTVSERMNSTMFGLVGALGARYDATDHLRLGLSLYSPELGVYGVRRAYGRIVDASETSPQVSVVNQKGLHATPSLPLRAQVGAAWVATRWTVAADAIVLGPRSVLDDPDRHADGLDQHIERRVVANASVGAEYVARGMIPLRAGFFTDFAASPAPQPKLANAPDPNPANSSHVNRYGGTFSVGYRTEHTATDIGVVASHGSGEVLVGAEGPVDRVPATFTMTLLYLFLSSAYQF